LKKEGIDLNTLDKTHEKTAVGSVILYRPIGGKTVHHANTSTPGFNQEQQSFIDKFVEIGYELNPSRLDQQSMVPYTDKELGAPADLFPNGLTLWYDPKKQSEINKDGDSIGTQLKAQETSAKSCKTKIKDYYTLYLRRKSSVITPSVFQRDKRGVQACKDQYYNNWPTFMLGGKTLDKYLDILSGNVSGGPSGEYDYFRLK
jgi:hypothetical protein